MRVALGLKARTGRAILIALGGDVRDPQFVERAEFKTLPDGAFAPYHVAAGIEDPDAARERIERDIAIAHRLAEGAIRDAAERLRRRGHEVRACGVLVGPGMPEWTLEQIIAVHPRMHQAEGELFRNVLVAGARACDLALTTLREKTALDDAAASTGIPRAQLDALVAGLGKAAGAPGAKDQKEAAVAALAALAALAR